MSQLDRQTIGQLYDRYGALVFRRCRSILGDEQAALDATQDVFIRVLRAGEDFRGDASPTTWLYRISTNLCLNRLRDSASRGAKLKEVAAQGEGPHSVSPAIMGGHGMTGARAMERQALVRALLLRTDEQTRQLVVYYYFDGMSHEEIAAVVGLSRPTVRKRLDQFVDMARRHLQLPEGAEAVVVALMLVALSAQALEVMR